MKMYYGIDFGTTNSSIAVLYPDGNSELIPDEGTGNPTIRSTIYFPEEGGIIVGNRAVQAYLERGMRGRMIQSIKWVLPDEGFPGILVDSTYFSVEELISFLLKHLKTMADKATGQEVDSVVMGRPAKFSENPKEDRIAQRRLYKAAEMAGFREIHFQLEPIAAGFFYERKIEHPEVALVVDLGGGTSDLTIMKLNPQKVMEEQRKEDILATDGIYLGGNEITSEIAWWGLLKHFGGETKYLSNDKWLPIPTPMLQAVYDWREIASIKANNSLMNRLEYVYSNSQDKASVGRLKTLIEKNLGYHLFLDVQEGKHQLSSQQTGQITFQTSHLSVQESVKRKDFQIWIAPKIRRLNRCISSVLASAKMTEKNIDTVFATGGTSFIPIFMTLLEKRFKSSKVHQGDAFVSVATGLALSALHLSASQDT